MLVNIKLHSSLLFKEFVVYGFYEIIKLERNLKSFSHVNK